MRVTATIPNVRAANTTDESGAAWSDGCSRCERVVDSAGQADDQAMDRSEIAELIAAFARAATLCRSRRGRCRDPRRASPSWESWLTSPYNRRDDEYAVPLTTRLRIVMRYRGCGRRVGRDLVVGARVKAPDATWDLDEHEVAQLLHATVGSTFSSQWWPPRQHRSRSAPSSPGPRRSNAPCPRRS